jgi:DNA primase
LSFDTDAAGVAAGERSIDLAATMDFNVKMLIVDGDFKDPAEVVQASHGLMLKFVSKALPSMEYYFRRYLKNDLDIVERKKNIRVLLTKIKQIASPVEREYFINELANRSNMGATTLIEEMQNLPIVVGLPLKAEKIIENRDSLITEKATRRDLISERVLVIVLNNPKLRSEVDKYKNSLDDGYKVLYESLGGTASSDIPSELQVLADKISFEANFSDANLKIDASEELGDLLRDLCTIDLRDKLGKIHTAIATAERMEDDVALSQALKEFDSITKQLHNGS